MALIEFPTEAFEKIIDSQGNTTFTGWILSLNEATSAAKWLIQRETKSGGMIFIDYASQKFDQVFDDRVALFATIPFVNQLSIQFDGNNDRVVITNDTTIDFENNVAFTASMWVKTTDAVWTAMEKTVTNRGYQINRSGQRLVYELRASGTGDRIRVRENADNSVLVDGSWHHIAVTYDGSITAAGVTLYIDAVAQAVNIQNDTLVGTTLNAGDLTLGASTGGGDEFAGNMDEPSIWRRELTSIEITAIYNLGFPVDLLLAEPLNLEMWLRNGDGDIFPNILDQTLNANDGVMTDMVAGNIEGTVPGE